jgi:hypothetical protein
MLAYVRRDVVWCDENVGSIALIFGKVVPAFSTRIVAEGFDVDLISKVVVEGFEGALLTFFKEELSAKISCS